MNIILFSHSEANHPLPRGDTRARHIVEVLKRHPGDTFDVGILNGPKGKAKLEAIDDRLLHLSFKWAAPPPPPPGIHLLVGLPRPQTARDVLRDATTLGLTSLHFVRTDKGEPSYANSSLWTSDEWQKQLIVGAQQAFCTQVPEVSWQRKLEETLSLLPPGNRWLLDNYEATRPFSTDPLDSTHPTICLAIGSERGWSPRERTLFRDHGFSFVHLGSRVLRTETAVVAALTLARAKLGLL